MPSCSALIPGVKKTCCGHDVKPLVSVTATGVPQQSSLKSPLQPGLLRLMTLFVALTIFFYSAQLGKQTMANPVRFQQLELMAEAPAGGAELLL